MKKRNLADTFMVYLCSGLILTSGIPSNAFANFNFPGNSNSYPGADLGGSGIDLGGYSEGDFKDSLPDLKEFEPKRACEGIGFEPLDYASQVDQFERDLEEARNRSSPFFGEALVIDESTGGKTRTISINGDIEVKVKTPLIIAENQSLDDCDPAKAKSNRCLKLLVKAMNDPLQMMYENNADIIDIEFEYKDYHAKKDSEDNLDSPELPEYSGVAIFQPTNFDRVIQDPSASKAEKEAAIAIAKEAADIDNPNRNDNPIGLPRMNPEDVDKIKAITAELVAEIDRKIAMGEDIKAEMDLLKTVNPSAAYAMDCIIKNSETLSKDIDPFTGEYKPKPSKGLERVGPLSGTVYVSETGEALDEQVAIGWLAKVAISAVITAIGWIGATLAEKAWDANEAEKERENQNQQNELDRELEREKIKVEERNAKTAEEKLELDREKFEYEKKKDAEAAKKNKKPNDGKIQNEPTPKTPTPNSHTKPTDSGSKPEELNKRPGTTKIADGYDFDEVVIEGRKIPNVRFDPNYTNPGTSSSDLNSCLDSLKNDSTTKRTIEDTYERQKKITDNIIKFDKNELDDYKKKSIQDQNELPGQCERKNFEQEGA